MHAGLEQVQASLIELHKAIDRVESLSQTRPGRGHVTAPEGVETQEPAVLEVHSAQDPARATLGFAL